jgi:hypothetical protein
MMIFGKNEFYVDEQAQVRIICVNTKCAKDVKSFKMKLIRQFKARTVGGFGRAEFTYIAK